MWSRTPRGIVSLIVISRLVLDRSTARWRSEAIEFVSSARVSFLPATSARPWPLHGVGSVSAVCRDATVGRLTVITMLLSWKLVFRWCVATAVLVRVATQVSLAVRSFALNTTDALITRATIRCNRWATRAVFVTRPTFVVRRFRGRICVRIESEQEVGLARHTTSRVARVTCTR